MDQSGLENLCCLSAGGAKKSYRIVFEKSALEKLRCLPGQ